MDNSGQDEPIGSGEIPGRKLTPFQQALVIISVLGAISVMNILLENIIQPSSLVFVYLLATIMSVFFFGTWPAVLTSLGGLLVYDFLFVEPKYKFSMYHTQDAYNVSVYFIMAIIIVWLIRTVQKQNLIVRFRLDRASFVEDMSREFLMMSPLEQPPEGERTDIRNNAISVIGMIILKHTGKIIKAPVFVSFRYKDQPLKIDAKSSADLKVEKTDIDQAYRALSEGQVWGAGIDPDARTKFFFIPLKSHEQGIGVVGIQYDYKNLSHEQQSLLRALSNLASMVAERWMRPF